MITEKVLLKLQEKTIYPDFDTAELIIEAVIKHLNEKYCGEGIGFVSTWEPSRERYEVRTIRIDNLNMTQPWMFLKLTDLGLPVVMGDTNGNVPDLFLYGEMEFEDIRKTADSFMTALHYSQVVRGSGEDLSWIAQE